VVEFQKGPSIATPPIVRHEGATPSIARHHFATGGTSHVRIARRTLLVPGPAGSTFLFLFELSDEEIGCAFEDDR
jgi:hypothetical protein